MGIRWIEKPTMRDGPFSFLAGESRATVFGGEGQETIRRAIKKILARLESGKFNSLEISGVVFKAFLGIPYASVSFHSRNLQKAMFLLRSQDSQAWKDATFVAA